MKSISEPSLFPVFSIGRKSRDILKSGSQGRILTKLSRAIYLNSIDNELFWLVTKNIAMHCRGVQLLTSLPRVDADSSYSVREQHLLLGNHIAFDLSPAATWVAPCPNLDEVIPLEELPDRLWTITCLFNDYPTPNGFGIYLLDFVKTLFGNYQLSDIPKSGLAEGNYQSAFINIVQACIMNDFNQIFRFGKDLVGLGEGLTPSGDDLIGGILFANFMLQEIYTQYQGFNPSDMELFLDYSSKRTNVISYTMMKDLAEGNASSPLHGFINALLTDQNLENVQTFGLELVQIGHSTGWDLLTGVWIGMLLSLDPSAALSNSLYDYTQNRFELRKESYGY
jgi:hypothetical protein